nr:HTTM domain-containing protein [Halarchaeum rubridurum]
MFALAAAFALAVLLGYHTRLALLCSVVLLVSLHARNPLVLNGGDSLLRRLAFWGLLLPLGSRWSLDALARARERARDAPLGPTRVATAASAALLLQVVLVYVVTALFKHQGTLWGRGLAVRYVFDLREFTVFFGPVLAGHALPLTAANYAWLALLTCAPLLVLTTGRVRAALVGAFALAHLGLLCTVGVGIFPLVDLVALLPFLPSVVWDAGERRLDGSRLAEGVNGVAARLPTPRDVTPSLPAGAARVAGRGLAVVVCVLLVAMCAWNAASLGYADLGGGEGVDPAQYGWNMFAPDPVTTEVWYVAPAETASGERVDAVTGGAVSWAPPPSFERQYPTARWRKLLRNAHKRDLVGVQRAYAGHLCARWNATHADDLERVSVAVAVQEARLEEPEPVAHDVRWAGRCAAARGASESGR